MKRTTATNAIASLVIAGGVVWAIVAGQGGAPQPPTSSAIQVEPAPEALAEVDWRAEFEHDAESRVRTQAIDLALCWAGEGIDTAAMASIPSPELDHRMQVAGRATPTLDDRRWALEIELGLLAGRCAVRYGTNYALPAPDVEVEVAYRDSTVDLSSGFLTVPLVPSGDVREAWWDPTNEYLVIDLNGTLYHYCAFDRFAVDRLAIAASAGDHYSNNIRGTHDCRTEGTVPSYGPVQIQPGEMTQEQFAGFGWAAKELMDAWLVEEGFARDIPIGWVQEQLVVRCVVYAGAEVDLAVSSEFLLEQVDAGTISMLEAVDTAMLSRAYNELIEYRSSRHCGTS